MDVPPGLSSGNMEMEACWQAWNAVVTGEEGGGDGATLGHASRLPCGLSRYFQALGGFLPPSTHRERKTDSGIKLYQILNFRGRVVEERRLVESKATEGVSLGEARTVISERCNAKLPQATGNDGRLLA